MSKNLPTKPSEEGSRGAVGTSSSIEVDAPPEILHKISKCKVKMGIKNSFYGNIAMGMNWLCVKSWHGQEIDTMATDGINILYNPSFVAKLTDDELQGVTAHEVAHKVLKHPLRVRGRDPFISNIAMDYVVNEIVLKDGWTMPNPHLRDPKYDGWPWEKVYQDLMKEVQKNKGGGKGGKGGGQGWGQVLEPLNGDGSKKSQEELNNIGQDIDAQARAAQQAAKMAGHTPGNLSEMVSKAMEPEIDYEEIIYKCFVGGGKPEYSMRRPNKAILQNYDMFSVGHDNQGAGIIGIGADVSGSIGNLELQNLLGIINSTIRLTGPEKVIVVQFDHVVSSIIEYSGDVELPNFVVTGRGGTDFNPQFEEIEKRGIKIDQYICVTDGYGPFPPEPPPFPVVWLMTTDVVAPWGITYPFKLKGE